MFGLDIGEYMVIGVVALVVLGPKELPRLLRELGKWTGKARAMSRHVRSGFDTMMREAEMEEMQKQWDRQNADILRLHPPEPAAPAATAPVEHAPE